MNCSRCQFPLPDGSKFCLNCGASTSGISGQESDVPVSVPPVADAGEERSAATISPLPTLIGPGGGAGDDGLPGTPLDARYEVQEEIAQGGFARVFKARDRRLDRVVAVKRLLDVHMKPGGASQALQRFIRESQAIASLNHRNIVQVFDTDKDAEGYYIVMEYVGGGTLREWLKEKQKLPVPDAIALARGIAQGLAYAHRRNLVHRDVKPGNVLLARDGGELEPKIVDFGLARMGSDSELSMTGYGMGTPYYMPPEQRRNAKSANHTADIYALGKIIYEMVSGEVPDNVLPHRIPQVPGLSALIFKCIESRPEERFFSMDDLIRALDAIPGARGGAGPAAGPARGVGGPGVCPACGMDNELAAKFCSGCGQGLFRPCPECKSETRITTRFCSGCGSDLEAFETAKSALLRMREYSQGKRWSRVLKEAGLVPEDSRLKGEIGRQMLAEIAALRKEAEIRQEELRSLLEQLNQAQQEQRLEVALRLARQYQSLDPSHAEMAGRAEQIARQIDERDFETADREARQALRERDMAAAGQAMERYLQRHEDGLHVAAARDWGQIHLPALDQYLGVLRLNGEMARARESGQAEQALRFGEELLACLSAVSDPDRLPELAPEACPEDERPLAAELQTAAQEEVARLKTAREQAQRLEAEARELDAAGGYEEALRLVREAEAVFPGDEGRQIEIGELGNRLNLQRQGVDRFRRLVAEARKALGDRRLVECRKRFMELGPAGQLIRVHESSACQAEWREARQAFADLERDLKAAERRHSEALERAQAALGAGDYPTCIEACAQARADGEDNPALDDLHEKAQSKQRQVEQYLAAAATHAERRQWLPAIEESCKALRLSPRSERVRRMNETARLGLAAAEARKRKIILTSVGSALALALLTWAGAETRAFYHRTRFEKFVKLEKGEAALEHARKIRKHAAANEFVFQADQAYEQRELAETQRKAGLGPKAAADLPEDWAGAEALLSAGETAAGICDWPVAERKWREAGTEFSKINKRSAGNKTRADAAAIELVEKRTAAENAAASRWATNEWLAAETARNNADAQDANGEYDRAATSRAQAAEAYETARVVAIGQARVENALKAYLAAYDAQNEITGREDNATVEELFRRAGKWMEIQAALDQGGAARQGQRWDDAVQAYGHAQFLLKKSVVPVRVQAKTDEAQRLLDENGSLAQTLEILRAIQDVDPAAALPERDQAGFRAVASALKDLPCVLLKEQASHLLALAADTGYAPAQYLQIHYAESLPPGQATRKLRSGDVAMTNEVNRLAKAKDPAAQFAVGLMIENGWYGSIEESKAGIYYRAAALSGFSPAMVKYGALLEDKADAKNWYRTAAEAKDTQGMIALGRLLLYESDGKFAAEALDWFRKAGEAGNPAGWLGMSDALDLYPKLSSRPGEAEDWLRNAALAGDADAMMGLAERYEWGSATIKRDLETAKKWYGQAAESGHSQAQAALDRLKKTAPAGRR